MGANYKFDLNKKAVEKLLNENLEAIKKAVALIDEKKGLNIAIAVIVGTDDEITHQKVHLSCQPENTLSLVSELGGLVLDCMNHTEAQIKKN